MTQPRVTIRVYRARQVGLPGFFFCMDEHRKGGSPYQQLGYRRTKPFTVQREVSCRLHAGTRQRYRSPNQRHTMRMGTRTRTTPMSHRSTRRTHLLRYKSAVSATGFETDCQAPGKIHGVKRLGMLGRDRKRVCNHSLQVIYRSKDEDQARLFFILGLFVGIIGLINVRPSAVYAMRHATRSAQQVIMHCGSPDPAVKRWANYSAIALVAQVVLSSSFPFVRVHALSAHNRR